MRSFRGGRRSVTGDVRGARYNVSVNALPHVEFEVQKLTVLMTKKERKTKTKQNEKNQ